MIDDPNNPGGDMLLKGVYENGMEVEMRANGFSEEMFTVRVGKFQKKFQNYTDADIFFERSVIDQSFKH